MCVSGNFWAKLLRIIYQVIVVKTIFGGYCLATRLKVDKTTRRNNILAIKDVHPVNEKGASIYSYEELVPKCM